MSEMMSTCQDVCQNLCMYYIHIHNIYIYTNMLELEYIEGEMSEFICPDKCPNICQNLCHKKSQAVFAEVGMTRSGLFLK